MSKKFEKGLRLMSDEEVFAYDEGRLNPEGKRLLGIEKEKRKTETESRKIRGEKKKEWATWLIRAVITVVIGCLINFAMKNII